MCEQKIFESNYIIYNKSWAQTPWLRQMATPNCRNFIKLLDFYRTKREYYTTRTLIHFYH